MARAGQTIRRSLPVTLFTMALAPFASAGDGATKAPVTASAPLVLPHAMDLLLSEQARKRTRVAGKLENGDFLVLTPGFSPVVWPRDTDVRARLLTPELKRTPVVGWLAENLYRSKDDNGWCLEVDPGEGEYVVFYRFHPRK
jgi:hypothetical protein